MKRRNFIAAAFGWGVASAIIPEAINQYEYSVRWVVGPHRPGSVVTVSNSVHFYDGMKLHVFNGNGDFLGEAEAVKA